MEYHHIPVLLNEVIENLHLAPGQIVIDGTVGGGGHAQVLLEKIGQSGFLYGFDRDPSAIKACAENLKNHSNLKLIQDSYLNIYAYRQEFSTGVDRILLDLGISSFQVSASDQRGFSFNYPAPLDMRFGPDSDLTAQEIVNNWSEYELIDLFQKYGEIKNPKLVVKQILNSRKIQEINTSDDLVAVIGTVVKRHGKIHPATVYFQALRLAVNQELEVIAEALPKLFEVLKPGGRLAVITFHSLEDRIVKNVFKNTSNGRLVNKKVIKPLWTEVKKNSRARSAKLRIIEKINN